VGFVGKNKEYSKNATIQAGYFHGLHKAVAEKTGISKPVIHTAIKEGDDSSPLKLKAIKAAIEIIKEREIGVEKISQYAEVDHPQDLVFNEPDGSQLYLKANKIYTYLDYLKWTFTDRVELIKGKIVKMSPAPGSIHQTVIGDLYYMFRTFFHLQSCNLFIAPFDVRFPSAEGKNIHTVVQPDLCVVCDGNKIDKRGCAGVPDLMLEIVSPGNTRHDVDTKFLLYQEAGVLEYWIVYPAEKLIQIYCLEEGEYIGLRPFTNGMVARGKLFPQLEINLDEVFDSLKRLGF
jgi:Uma2 family endonuclease